MRYSYVILLIFFLFLISLKTRSFSVNIRSKKIDSVKIDCKNGIDSFADDSNPFTICEIPIDSKINQQEWEKYLQDNLVLDSASLDTIPAGVYTAFVSFEIDEDGKVSRILNITDPGYSLGQRAADVILQYKRRWEPSEIHGQKLKSYKRQPVTFVVEEDMEEKCSEQTPGELIL